MNKYIIFSISVIFVISLFTVFNIDDTDSDETIVGISTDYKKTDSGYVFYIIDGYGNEIKSFYSSKTDDSLHSFKGKYSDDRSIFFVSKIE